MKLKLLILVLSFMVLAIVLVVAVVLAFKENSNEDNSSDEILQSSDSEDSEDYLSFESNLSLVDESDLVDHTDSLDIESSLELSETEIGDLLFMREEEKLAHDVYTTLFEKWNLDIFNNISDSEQKHTDSISNLIQAYNLEDPYIDGVGNFSNEVFTTLYTDLVTQGSVSIESALSVGALIEDLDIVDLEKAMSNTDNESILTVYANLQKGSRNHIRSFTSMLSRYGESYTPTYLTQDEYLLIISSEYERGSLNSKGQMQAKDKK